MILVVRRGLLAFVAVLVAEAVWILAVPPFRGSDEVDHAFRAAGAASGQLYLGVGTPQGRGHLVWVPTTLLEAAQPQCESLSYVGQANCHAIATDGDRSRVATAAGDYDPLYYVVVGTLARPFHGVAFDYALRVVNALLCALLLATAVGLMTWAGTGRWANLGVVAALMPEVLFSGAIPAPNGVEMSCAFVLWAGLLAAVRQDGDRPLQRRLLLVAGAAAVPLSFMRFLGPLWVLLIVGSVVLILGVREAKDVVRRQRGAVLAVAGAVAMGVLWCVSWLYLNSRATGIAPDVDTKKWVLAFNLPAYVLQMVGAFPYRDIPAPLGVYPLALFVIVLLFGAAWRRGPSPHARRAIGWLGLTSLLVPIVLSLVLMPSQGAVWQGRYELPFVIGILPLCGLLLDEAGFAAKDGRRLAGLAGVALVITQVACPIHVQQLELQRPVSVAESAWWHPPAVVLGVLMLAACAVAWRLVLTRGPASLVEPADPVVSRSIRLG
jgi:hypothetical protein